MIFHISTCMMDIHGLLNKNLHLSTKEGPQFMFSLCFVSCTRLKILKVHVIHLTKGAGYRLINKERDIIREATLMVARF